MNYASKFLILASIAIAAGACAPRVQEAGLADIAPALNEDHVVATGGAILPLRRWGPDSAPRAIIVALHGFNDYSRAFDMAATAWQERGILTLAYDQRGFGEGPERGIWPGADLLVLDLETVVGLTHEAYPGAPLFVLGHSMGAAVTIHALGSPETGNLPVDGAILVSPAVWGGRNLNPFYRVLLWIVAHVTPSHEATGRSLGRIPSDNRPMLRELSRDPLTIKETRMDAVYGLVNLMGEADRRAANLDLPILTVYGEQDQIIPLAAYQRLEGDLGEHQTNWYADGYHLILRDLQAENVWRDIAAWIEERIPPTL